MRRYQWGEMLSTTAFVLAVAFAIVVLIVAL